MLKKWEKVKKDKTADEEEEELAAEGIDDDDDGKQELNVLIEIEIEIWQDVVMFGKGGGGAMIS